MRTIKFRGKRLSDGEWIYGYYFVNRGMHYITADERVNPLAKPEDYKVDPETVGQFTGIVNIGKREIYEGDILTGNVIVSWDYLTAGYDISIDSLLKGVKVIGNIHDNPELLAK